MKIYLDDLRNIPDESWVVVRTPDDFKRIISQIAEKKSPIEAISFDNDLAQELEGRDLLKWMVEKYPEYVVGDTVITVHSSNPEARRRMEDLVSFCREHKDDLLGMRDRPYPFGEIER